MSGFVNRPPSFKSNVFNPSFYSTDSVEGITLNEADTRYLSVNGGSVAGSLNVSGGVSASYTRLNNPTNYNGIMDTASLVLRHPVNTNGNRISIDFSISGNVIDNINTPTCSIIHERVAAYQGDLLLCTKRVASASGSVIEAMRITSSGAILVSPVSNSDFQLNLGSTSTGIRAPAMLLLNSNHTATSNPGISQPYLTLGDIGQPNSGWEIGFSRQTSSGANSLSVTGTNPIYGLSLGALGGAVFNGQGGSGAFISATTLSSQLGTVHVNGSLSRAVASGYGYTSSGQGSTAGGTVGVSIYASSNVWSAGSFFSSSDERLKCNIETIQLSEAKKLLGVSARRYNWKQDPNGSKMIGCTAQDLIKADLEEDFTQLVPNDDMPEKTAYVVMYDRISLYLLELVKDLYKLDEAKQADIDKLKDVVDKLTSRPVVQRWLDKN